MLDLSQPFFGIVQLEEQAHFGRARALGRFLVLHEDEPEQGIVLGPDGRCCAEGRIVAVLFPLKSVVAIEVYPSVEALQEAVNAGGFERFDGRAPDGPEVG